MPTIEGLFCTFFFQGTLTYCNFFEANYSIFKIQLKVPQPKSYNYVKGNKILKILKSQAKLSPKKVIMLGV